MPSGRFCVLFQFSIEHIVAVYGLGGDEIGRDNHIVNIVFFQEIGQGVGEVLAVVNGIDIVVILAQEGHIAVAKRVLEHHAVGRVRKALVYHMGQRDVRCQKCAVPGVLILGAGLKGAAPFLYTFSL